VVVSFIVIQAADVLGDALALPDFTLPLVTVLTILGFPLAIVLAWAYELTDQGIRRDEEVTEEPPVALPETAAEVDRRSVAVLPFANLSGEDENEYFSDGITEDIITTLSKIRDLHVVSRTSVMRYKDSSESISKIAETLGVATVLEGSVRRSEGRVRISAKLIDAVEDRHLWVESYDHRLEDIFKIQSDVSGKIATALAAEISSDEQEVLERRPTEDVEAYDLYLKGRYLWRRRTEDGLEKSIAYYGRSLERDPDFSLAQSGIADSYVTQGLYGLGNPAEVMPLAREAATRALVVDPNAAEALTALAAVRSLYDWNWAEAEGDYRRAIEMRPHYPVSHHWLGANLLVPLGRFEEARESTQKALELDPLSEAIGTSLGVICLYSGECEAAIDEFSRVLDVYDWFGIAHYFKGQAHEHLGQFDEAIDAFRRASELTGSSSEVLASLGHAFARAGREDEARAMLSSLEERFGHSYGSPGLLARIHLGLGDHETALGLLEDAAEVRAIDVVWLGVRPIYSPLRGSDRFERILKTVGIGGVAG